MFDSVNQQVGQIAGDVGTTPANFSPVVFSMIRNISGSVILLTAGMVLTSIACYELIQMLTEHNNLANFETWTFFKWVFKTFLAVPMISNTFNITMAVFDVAQQVISRSGDLISGSTSVSDTTPTAMQATLESMDLGPLLGLASKQHVSRTENGERSCSIDLLIELYCILHVSTDYLLMGSETSKEEVKNDLLSIISELSTIAKKI